MKGSKRLVLKTKTIKARWIRRKKVTFAHFSTLKKTHMIWFGGWNICFKNFISERWLFRPSLWSHVIVTSIYIGNRLADKHIISGVNSFHIFLGLASIPVCMTIVGLSYMFWTNPIKCKCCKKRESSMKMDINSDVYGTYSRGEDGGGEYGDGDRVYVQDSNDYYGS